MSEHDRVNILLVDDQPAKLMSYEVILRELGENLLTASSAQEAFEHLLRHDVAVVLIDVIMPDLDGFELAQMIRAHPRFQTVALIFVSAIALTDIDRIKGYEHGAVDYVPVPVVPDVLRAKVRIFSELFRKTRQLERLNVELERRVAERTAELAQANAELERRVEERTREREMALAQVHEMQKLESLGQLTGGLAHDFNNVLMAVLGNLDLVSRHMPDGVASKSLVNAAIQAAERGATLTKRMLAFARRQELQPEAVNVQRLANTMVEMLRRSLGPVVEIGMEFEDGLALVRVDPNQLELAILNLALNARDAMPDGGRLSLAARGERVVAGSVQGLATGDYVRLTVSDTGTGMDEATLKRAAEPFFTTKGTGKGTGLGLSMVYGLAAQSGGVIRIQSRLGAGTTVELWLPVAAAEEAQRPRPAATLAVVPTRSFAVLLVDDDPMVSSGTSAMLQDLGHSVVTAASAAHALDMLRCETPVDLVITDHAMPGMTGAELAKHIRDMRPDLPIILATGYAEVPNNLISGMPRLDKPYRLDKLASMIAAVVEHRMLDVTPAA
jgi:signal transduction histidine kinase